MSKSVKHAMASSQTVKRVQAGVLAAVLVLLGSIRSEAASLMNTFSPGSESQTFDFGDYLFDLSFDMVNPGSFIVTVTDTIVSPEILALRFGAFPGYRCVPFANGGTDCVDFEVEAPAPGPGPDTWTGFFDITVRWFEPTDALFPNEGNRIRILHNRGDHEGNNFDTDITVDGSYVEGCVIGCEPPCCFDDAGDPAIGGRDDNFQSFTVVQAPVPEPATMFLLGSGLIGLVQQRRRRLKSLVKSGHTPRASDRGRRA